MKYNRNILKIAARALISAESNPWEFKAEILNHFTGNKRIRKKKAKKFLNMFVNDLIHNYIKEVNDV